ncbi:MAG: TonB-dependent receptor [Ferruginibacter sp.]
MKYRYKRILICSSSLLFNFLIASYAQTSIKGKVVDAHSRQPLESASISDSNASGINATTDQNGNFSIKPGMDSFTLLVSAIGYKTISFYIKGKENIKIEMQPSIIDLKYVVLETNHPTKFTTVSKIDLDLKPVRNTQELLRLVPGLFIAQHAGGGKAEQIFLRGFDCDHGTDVQLSVDGMPVNMVSHAHGQGYADAHFIIPETINSVDFGAGPYYTQHGNLNTAGYVAFSSLNNIDKSTLQVEGGRYSTVRALAMIDLLKKNKDKQSAYIASEYYYTNGPTINNQNFNRFNIFGKYSFAISDNTQLTASVSAFKSKWDASGQVPNRAVESGLIDRFGSIDPSEGGNTERYNASLVVSRQSGKGINWENQLFYSRYIFNLFSNFTFFANDPVNGDEINQAESRNIIGYSSKLDKKYAAGNWLMHSIFGAGLRHDATNDSKLANTAKRRFLGYVKLGDIKETNLFAYAHQQASIGKWLFDAGVRYDYLHFDYSDKLNTLQMKARGKSIISPKLNIQYTVNSMVQLFVKSGKGFHSNDTRVVAMNQGKEILPAAYGIDIGVASKPTRNLFLSVAVWNLYLDQEFVYVGDDGNVEPSGKTKREGIDFMARYQFGKSLFANANVNFTKPRARGEIKGQDYIPLAPTATSTGGFFYKTMNGFNGSVTYRYISSRPANEDNSIVAKGYTLLDGSINYTKSKYEIGLALENIFNIKWNEAQFATDSRLMNEPATISELNFTPGTPFFVRLKFAVFF